MPYTRQQRKEYCIAIVSIAKTYDGKNLESVLNNYVNLIDNFINSNKNYGLIMSKHKLFEDILITTSRNLWQEYCKFVSVGSVTGILHSRLGINNLDILNEYKKEDVILVNLLKYTIDGKWINTSYNVIWN